MALTYNKPLSLTLSSGLIVFNTINPLESVSDNGLSYVRAIEMCGSHLSSGCTDVKIIIESVDSISRDEQDVPLTQYITNA